MRLQNYKTKVINGKSDDNSSIIKEIYDNAGDIDTLMPMYNLIEHNDNYSKTSRS